MKLDDHIIDLLIQWEDRQRSGQPISVQELANGKANVEQQLETLIPRMTITDWVHTKPNPNSTGLDLPSKEILKQSLIMPNDLTLERFLSNLKKAELCDPQEIQQFTKQHATSNVHQLVNALVEAELLTPFQARAVAHGKIKGLTLGNYLILDKIGEGGMGAVYKARHNRLDRIVALKVLPRESKKNQALIARFLQEAQTAAKLSHPNIVATHDSDEAHGYQFLVMEYIDGKDLSVSIKRKGALSVTKAVDYLIQAARGLEYAHGQGIIHRDIKPHNLLVDKNELVKILDMGLARVEARAEDDDALTKEGAIMGTVDYMPPEQAIDTKSVDRRADLYSLGSTLHFLLTGKPPFEGNSLLVKMLAHREQAPPDLTQVRRDVHPRLNFVFQKLMSKLPDARYQSAGELIATLEALRPEIESYENSIGPAPPPLPQINTESDTSLSQLSQISASVVKSLSLDSLFKSEHLRKLAALPKHQKIAGAVAAVVMLCLCVYLLASLMSGSIDVVVDDPVVPVVELPGNSNDRPTVVNAVVNDVLPDFTPPIDEQNSQPHEIAPDVNATFGKVQVGALDESVVVNVPDEGATLSAWIDFNRDGSIGGPGEKILSNVKLIAGDNLLYFDIPSWAVSGTTNAQFKISLNSNSKTSSHDIKIQSPTPTSGQFVEQKPISILANYASSVFTADVDGDGDLDVLSASQGRRNIAWYNNDGQQNFSEQIVSKSTGFGRSVFATDVDSDGDMDILSASWGNDIIAWHKNDGQQNFTENIISSSSDGAKSVFAADMDGDGDLDILSASMHDDKIAWYKNDGRQNFTEQIISASADWARSVFAADVDSDGDMDVLSASSGDNKIAWYKNDGKQNFTEQIISASANVYRTSFEDRSVFAADVDSDGDMDILSASQRDHKITWYKNDGQQDFTEQIISASANGVKSVFVADMDGDGDLDILSDYSHGDRIAWYKNDGQQNFTVQIIKTSADRVNSVFAADVDSDGDLDILSASANDDKITWYKNINDPSPSNPVPTSSTNNPAPTSPPIVITPPNNPPVDPQPNTKDAFISTPGFPMVVLKAGTESYVPRLLESAVDEQGNIFVLCAQPVDRDFNPIISNQESIPDREVYYLTKLDPTGNQLWSRKIEATKPIGLAVDHLGNCYVTGDFTGIAKVENEPISTQLSSSSRDNIFIFSFNSDGRLQWSKSYGENGKASVFAITTSPTGEIYLSGYGSKEIITDPQPQPQRITEEKFLIIQLSNQGSVRWVKEFPDLSRRYKTITSSRNGKIYVLALISKRADLDPGANQDWHTPEGMNANTCLICLERNGDYSWSQVISNLGYFAEDIAVDHQENVYITGFFQVDTLTLLPNEENLKLNVQGASDIYLLALDSRGKYRWSHRVGNEKQEREPKVVTDAHANIHLAFKFSETIRFNSNQGVKSISSNGNYGDIALIKYDTSGTVLAVQSMGYQSHEAPSDILCNSSGDIIVTGTIDLITDDASFVVAPKQFNWKYIKGIYLNKLKPNPGYSTPVSSANSPAVVPPNPAPKQNVTFGKIQVGALDASVTINVPNAGSTLSAWIDFNRDGSTGGPGEKIFSNVDLIPGDNLLHFDVPSWAVSGTVNAQFQINLDSTFETTPHQVAIQTPQRTSGKFVEQTAISTKAMGASSVFSADMDGDGDMDVLSASFITNKIVWYENGGEGILNEHIISTTAAGTKSVYAVDMDGDGDLDIVSASKKDTEAAWYENDGNQNFSKQEISKSVSGARCVFVSDLDADGDLDIVSASTEDYKISWHENLWYENSRKLIFRDQTAYILSRGISSLFAADVDGDGDMDLLSASDIYDEILWYKNNGNQNFSEQGISKNADGANSVFAVDIDSDGDLDVLSAASNDNKIAWYQNNGSEQFTEITISISANGARSVFAADMDGDGDVDVLSASTNDDKIAWYENDGNQNFKEQIISTSADGATSVFAADMDGDGDLDILSASQFDNKITWYKNTNDPSTGSGVPPSSANTNNPSPANLPLVVTPVVNVPNNEFKTIQNSIGMKLNSIPAGVFQMGDGNDRHQVTLTKPFYMGVYEVTQAEYELVMDTDPTYKRVPKLPIGSVNWSNAIEFCEKLSDLPAEKAAGRSYRLPTEAEWEYACRAGSTTKFFFGDDYNDLIRYAWHEDGDSQRKSHPIGLKRPNAWGLYDMLGNEKEWCQDSYAVYPSEPVTDPLELKGESKVARGGSYIYDSDKCHPGHRFKSSPRYNSASQGLRVVMELNTQTTPKPNTSVTPNPVPANNPTGFIPSGAPIKASNLFKPATPPPTLTDPKIKAMVQRGVDYLNSIKTSNRLGEKCLVALALHKAGEPKLNPKIQAALITIRNSAPEISRLNNGEYGKFDHAMTYDVAHALILLCEAEPAVYSNEIAQLITYFVNHQKKNGGWGYPLEDLSDNSMTQHVVMGLWLAKSKGFDVPDKTIEDVCNYTIRVQDPNGAWGYKGIDPGVNAKARVSQSNIGSPLVNASLATLYTCTDFLGLNGRKPSGRKAVNSTFLRNAKKGGLDWLAKNPSLDIQVWRYYLMYSMERFESFQELELTRTRTNRPWYVDGVDFLEKEQNKDGSWVALSEDGSRATSFAILFLVRNTQNSIQNN